MHRRLLPWLVVGVFFAVVCLRVEAQGVLNQRGKIIVVKVSGKVTKTVNGVVTPLERDSVVETPAKIITGPGSSVVLSFSNGTTTRLGEASELVVEEFLQDPFPGMIKPMQLTEEPTPSRTKLALNRGELVADVKTLKRKADGFTVQTPVGTVSARGTVFRIVFRPTSSGQAFFQLATARGSVHYTPPGGGQAQGPTGTTAGAAGVAISEGQEIAFRVDLTTNAQGQMVLTGLPLAPPTAAPASAATMQQVMPAAVEMAEALRR